MSGPVHYHYSKFPPKMLDWEKIISLIGPANAALARYDGILSAIPNAWILLGPLMTQEAVLSSRIEGTQAHLREVLEYEADSKEIPPERTEDIHEVLNYRFAMHHAVQMLKELPLCQRVVREAHQILISGVRGQNKSPGEYRRDANWIGPPGCTLDEARFIPISADKLQNGMDTWEQYIHAETPDRLVQLALLHAEFEALHPFLDGNGRLGRMCIPLFMSKMGLIESPMFYISAFFDANRNEYYDRLLAVSQDDDWTGWCMFFLRAVESQARNNHTKTMAILSLYNEMKPKIVEITHSQYSIHTLDFIFSQPIFTSSDFLSVEIPSRTARHILNLLRKNNIVTILRSPRGRRPAIYAFPRLLDITENQ